MRGKVSNTGGGGSLVVKSGDGDGGVKPPPLRPPIARPLVPLLTQPLVVPPSAALGGVISYLGFCPKDGACSGLTTNAAITPECLTACNNLEIAVIMRVLHSAD